MLRLERPADIHVVDPSAAALDVARTRAGEVHHGTAHAVFFASSADALPDALDYAIVATNADIRLPVIEALLARSRVRHLLLEKVLFQSVAEYDRAQEILRTAGVSTWVDCARRVYPNYDDVKAFFADEAIRTFDVTGGGWGLGCNIVHFLDIFAHLSGEIVDRIDTRELDDRVVQSRRAGFVEVTGTLTGRSPRARFSATCHTDNRAGILITIRSDSRSCVIDEAGGMAFFGDHRAKTWSQEPFVLPFLSEASTGIARDILGRGKCALPDLAESSAVHVPLIRALAAFISGRTGGPADVCPIT
ncbi:hypothetical protein ASG29_14310 [Sphingomonas sp. Leaf412]|nr:hypothetical protein ASG29_14310 [Sphingomonas sp. Leaf412]